MGDGRKTGSDTSRKGEITGVKPGAGRLLFLGSAVRWKDSRTSDIPGELGPLHGNGKLDERVAAVVQQGEVLKAQVEEGLGLDFDSGEGKGLSL